MGPWGDAGTAFSLCIFGLRFCLKSLFPLALRTSISLSPLWPPWGRPTAGEVTLEPSLELGVTVSPDSTFPEEQCEVVGRSGAHPHPVGSSHPGVRAEVSLVGSTVLWEPLLQT